MDTSGAQASHERALIAVVGKWSGSSINNREDLSRSRCPVGSSAISASTAWADRAELRIGRLACTASDRGSERRRTGRRYPRRVRSGAVRARPASSRSRARLTPPRDCAIGGRHMVEELDWHLHPHPDRPHATVLQDETPCSLIDLWRARRPRSAVAAGLVGRSPARRPRRAHATDGCRLLHRLFRRSLCRCGAGTDLSADAIVGGRGVHASAGGILGDAAPASW